MSARRRLPSRLGCAPGAGLRSLGSRRWWRTRWWPTRWSVAAVSDAAGKAVPAGVAGQALPEPYVPGSGDRVPAELRLVLAGYVGIAVWLVRWRLGLRRGCSSFSFSLSTTVDLDDDLDRAVVLLGLHGVCLVCFAGLGWGCEGVQALKARIRFSRLLRRPSDPRTATVTASKRGGRTLILDIPRRHRPRYQPLSEVRLALWMKAGMLVPGERVTVYGGPGSKNPLLISSAQRGRAFLGTVESRSTVQRRAA